jgi:hypothetical protein
MRLERYPLTMPAAEQLPLRPERSLGLGKHTPHGVVLEAVGACP